MFTEGYIPLHPEKVQAAAIGGPAGIITLPLDEPDGTRLNWPAGISDLSSLVGYECDKTANVQAPQYVYLGAVDTNTIVDVFPDHADLEFWASGIIYEILGHRFGVMGIPIVEHQVQYLQANGFPNVSVRVYRGMGHQATNENQNDVFKFLDRHR